MSEVDIATILRRTIPPAGPGRIDLASTFAEWPNDILTPKFAKLVKLVEVKGCNLTLEDVKGAIGEDWNKEDVRKMWQSYGYWKRGTNSRLLLPSGSSGYFAYKDQQNKWQPTALGALVMLGREEMVRKSKLWDSYSPEGEIDALAAQEDLPPAWLGAGSGALTSIVIDGKKWVPAQDILREYKERAREHEADHIRDIVEDYFWFVCNLTRYEKKGCIGIPSTEDIEEAMEKYCSIDGTSRDLLQASMEQLEEEFLVLDKELAALKKQQPTSSDEVEATAEESDEGINIAGEEESFSLGSHTTVGGEEADPDEVSAMPLLKAFVESVRLHTSGPHCTEFYVQICCADRHGDYTERSRIHRRSRE